MVRAWAMRVSGESVAKWVFARRSAPCGELMVPACTMRCR